MNRTIIALTIVSALLVVLVVGPHFVKADPKTIVVPDDYSTLTEAINNANNGDTILIREGTYEGPINQTVVINKRLSII